MARLVFPMLLVFYEISTYLSNDMYLPAVPEMMRDLHLSMAEVQLTLTTWFIGLASMPLIIGVISDRFGRRPVLLIGGMLYVLASLGCALTTNFSLLLFARLVEGGMVATMMVAGYACIHELYEHKEAVRILALMGSISVLAPALGPLLGSVVLYFLSWRGIFWVIVIWASLAILLLHKWMPETQLEEQRQKIDLSRLLKSYANILTNKKFMLLMFVLGFIFCGFIVWITAGPLLVIENFHQTAMTFSLIQAAIFAAYIVGSHGVKQIVERLDMHRVIRIGLIITLMGGLLLLLLAFLFPRGLYAFLIAMMIYSFGAAFCFAPLNRAIIDSSNEAMGVRVAIFTVFFTSFAALGSGLASVFFNGSILSLALLICSAIILSCVVKKFS